MDPHPAGAGEPRSRDPHRVLSRGRRVHRLAAAGRDEPGGQGFVACQEGRLGVLVLSRFAGAARQLREALLVNPYDLGATAATLYRALSLPAEERERRIAALRQRVERHTIQDWMDDIFAEVERLRPRR
ncbi:MAG: trehalose-6-phosphate synthase [Gemmatimonadetes bacterium]|nr:trehalose-6-phosphate synthase [Gemmatimonadota bacterium]